jgi:hypothetical protein
LATAFALDDALFWGDTSWGRTRGDAWAVAMYDDKSGELKTILAFFMIYALQPVATIFASMLLLGLGSAICFGCGCA